MRAAETAGKLLLASYGKLKSTQISAKSKNDFVTVLDKKSEEAVIRVIRRFFPDHGILAEEGGTRNTGAECVWIIDPLDGTSNYIHCFPMFAVSIGVAVKGVICAGVVHDPLHREMFYTERGSGAFLNKKRFRVSKTAKLADALMTTGIPFRARNRYDEYFDSLKLISLGSAGMRRGGSAALDLAYVACGRLDGFWELSLAPWDIAAGSLLIEEAGGRVTDLWGGGRYLNCGDILGSNRKIHAELQAITSRITRLPVSANRCGWRAGL